MKNLAQDPAHDRHYTTYSYYHYWSRINRDKTHSDHKDIMNEVVRWLEQEKGVQNGSG